MTMYAKARVRVATQQSFSETLNLGQLGHNPGIDQTVEFFDGVGVGQVDVQWTRRLLIGSGATATIDLNGADADAFGNGNSFLTLCGIYLNAETYDGIQNTTNITVGGGANPFLGLFGVATGVKVMRPGQVFCRFNAGTGGLGTVIPGTGDLIAFTNAAGASATIQVSLIGRST